MRAAIKAFHSPDVDPDPDLDHFTPADDADVGILVQLLVGPAGEQGEESFDVVVCTPRWLEREPTGGTT